METKIDEQEVVEDKFGTDESPLESDAVDPALATEALDGVSDDPAKKADEAEEMVPLSKYMGEKNARKEAENKVLVQEAEQRGRDAERAEAAKLPVEQEKSPIQALMDEQEVTSEDELVITAVEALKLGRAQTKFENAQEAKKAAVASQEDKETQATTMRETAKAVDRGEGLDYDTIIDAGSQLLTKGENIDWQNSDTPFELGYKLCIRAILERGDESTKKTLQDNLARKTDTSVKDGDPPKKEETVVADDVTSDEEIVNPRLKGLAAGIFNT